jgi:hypothetical protein
MATQSKRRKGRQTPTQARAARRASQQRRKWFLRIAALTAVGAVAVVFIFSLFAGGLQNIASPQGPAPDGPGVRYSSQGSTHISRDETHAPYNSVPATSGWHYADLSSPARWGVYDEPVEDEVLVHNLEHAGVVIHYNCPEGCDEMVEQLEEIVKGATKLVLAPNPDIGTKIALTAWTFLDELDEFNQVRIEAFISAHVNSANAPEPFVR